MKTPLILQQIWLLDCLIRTNLFIEAVTSTVLLIGSVGSKPEFGVCTKIMHELHDMHDLHALHDLHELHDLQELHEL